MWTSRGLPAVRSLFGKKVRRWDKTARDNLVPLSRDSQIGVRVADVETEARSPGGVGRIEPGIVELSTEEKFRNVRQCCKSKQTVEGRENEAEIRVRLVT